MKNYIMAAATLTLLGAAMPTRVHANCSEVSTEDRAKKLDKFASDLKLTPDQKAQVKTIKEEKWQKIDSAESEARDKIRTVLTPEQQGKFDKIVEKKAK